MTEPRRAAGRPLDVFLSSTMEARLTDVRDVIATSLLGKGVTVWAFEKTAQASPANVVQTSLDHVRQADLYIGLFCREYGAVTVEEFRHARELDKPCLIYIRSKDLPRDGDLEAFLREEVYHRERGVTWAYFEQAVEMEAKVTGDIGRWLDGRVRQLMTGPTPAAAASEEMARLRAVLDCLRARRDEERDTARRVMRPLPRGRAGLLGKLTSMLRRRGDAFDQLGRHVPDGPRVRLSQNTVDLNQIAHLEGLEYGQDSIGAAGLLTWWRCYPRGVHLVQSGSEIIGAIGLWPIARRVYDDLIGGRIEETEIGRQPGDIGDAQTMYPFRYWYVGDIILQREYRTYKHSGILLALLHRAVTAWLDSGDVDSTVDLCALAFSSSGRKLLSKFSFVKDVEKHSPKGYPIYVRTETRDVLRAELANITEGDDESVASAE